MNVFSSIWFLAQNPISNYWHKATDRTFSGIYHVNACSSTTTTNIARTFPACRPR